MSSPMVKRTQTILDSIRSLRAIQVFEHCFNVCITHANLIAFPSAVMSSLAIISPTKIASLFNRSPRTGAHRGVSSDIHQHAMRLRTR